MSPDEALERRKVMAEWAGWRGAEQPWEMLPDVPPEGALLGGVEADLHHDHDDDIGVPGQLVVEYECPHYESSPEAAASLLPKLREAINAAETAIYENPDPEFNKSRWPDPDGPPTCHAQLALDKLAGIRFRIKELLWAEEYERDSRGVRTKEKHDPQTLCNAIYQAIVEMKERT